MKRHTAKDQLPQIVTLSAQGKSQRQIGEVLGMSVATVNRALKGQDQNVAEVQKSLATQLMESIDKHVQMEQRGLRYADLALNAKNEAVSLGALQRIDDLQGIVTERERMRIDRQTATPQIQPMFMMPVGTQISVTVSTPAPLHIDKDAINVTPEKPTEG